MYLYQATNKDQSIFFNFKSPILYIRRIQVIISYINVLLFKLRILIQWKIWHNDESMACQ
jgi:hypothetical protein